MTLDEETFRTERLDRSAPVATPSKTVPTPIDVPARLLVTAK